MYKGSCERTITKRVENTLPPALRGKEIFMSKKYSNGQKKAYYSGMGYAAAHKGKAIPFKSDKNKQSFREGYKKGVTVIVKYPDLKK